MVREIPLQLFPMKQIGFLIVTQTPGLFGPNIKILRIRMLGENLALVKLQMVQ